MEEQERADLEQLGWRKLEELVESSPQEKEEESCGANVSQAS